METTFKKVSELIENNECPLPLEVIPNNMGINLCSVDAISWQKQSDGQLTNLTIHFIPNSKKKRVIPNVPKSELSQLNIGVPEKSEDN